MPVNKSAVFRFEVIDACLRNNLKKWSKSDLLSYLNLRLNEHYGSDCSISLSQLRYDLQNMQVEYGAPIEMYRQGREYFYRYEDRDFSIKDVPIDDEDIAKLNSAVTLLQQIKGFTIAEDIAEVVNKLERKCRLNNASHDPVILFESAPDIHGIENLEDIYLAIIRKTPLKISYGSFHSKQPKEHIVHPYILKQHKHRWYLLGFNSNKQALNTYALDRIIEIKVARESFISNTTLDVNNYFNHIIGVTKPPQAQPEYLNLMFTGFFAPYILTQPIHHSQKIIEQYEDGSLHVQLYLIINNELISTLLSYGDALKVIMPEKLTLQMHASAQQMLNYYDE